jgi:(R,R)-butanediol dehydrogenase/meso-butanediol dehydrogenase/diacetyl reductase
VWFGLTSPNGALGDLAVVRPHMIHRLPPELDLVTGALVEPLSVAHHAVELAQAQPDDLVVVFGAGPIGIGAFLALRAHGVEKVIIVEPSASRRATIESLGAITVDPSLTDPRDVVAEQTRGEGAEVVVDAAGVQDALSSGLDVLAARGRLVIVAAHTSPVQLDLLSVLMREVELRVSFAYSGDFPRVIRHLADGGYTTTSWVERVPFDALVNALERLHSGEANKVLVEIG